MASGTLPIDGTILNHRELSHRLSEHERADIQSALATFAQGRSAPAVKNWTHASTPCAES